MSNDAEKNETDEHHYRLLKETPRAWQLMKDREAILTLIEQKLNRRPLFLKGTHPAAEFTPGERRGDGLEFYCNPSVPLNTKNTLFVTLNRQLEIDFALSDQISPGHVVLTPLQVRVGSVQRASPRVALKAEEVTAANFRLSTNKITPNNTKLQITTQVIFPEFQKLYQDDAPGLQVMLAGDPKLPHEMSAQKPEQGLELNVRGQKHYMQPVYMVEDGVRTLLALLYLPTSVSGAPTALRLRLEELADELLQKVIDANASFIKERQKVVNISEGGVALQIDSEVLQKNLPLRDWLTFDLLFKMHAPIRFYGHIRHIGKLDGEWLVGIDLSGLGHSDYRKGTKEVYRSLVQQLKGS